MRVAVVDHGRDVAVARRGLGERAEHVELGDRARDRLQAIGSGGELGADLAEQRRLELADRLARGEDAVLELLEARRDEALGADQGLLALEVGRHQREVGLADLDVVAEDAVVGDAQASGCRCARAPPPRARPARGGRRR